MKHNVLSRPTYDMFGIKHKPENMRYLKIILIDNKSMCILIFSQASLHGRHVPILA